MRFHEVMQYLKDQETLVENPRGWTCWLRAGNDPCIGLYGRSHATLRARIYTRGDDLWVQMSISSIDDTHACLEGPVENREKAEKRLARVLNVIKGWDGTIPSYTQLRDAGYATGMCPTF